MTIGEALKAVQSIKQTQIPRAQLVRWLDEVDQTVMRELVSTHEFGRCLVFDGYDPEDETGADSTVLLAPKPYDRMYVYFLCAQIDMQNQEFDLYQNNAALYNTAFNDYAAYYNRLIRPAPKPRFNAWGTRRHKPKPGGCGCGKADPKADGEGGAPTCCCQSSNPCANHVN